TAPEFDKFFPELIKNEVQITNKKGICFSAQSQNVKGDENFPLKDGDIKNKFAWLSRKRLDKNQAKAIVDEIGSLQEKPSITKLINSFTNKMNKPGDKT
ncbi:hypothetical protein, partial [Desulfobacula sp.]